MDDIANDLWAATGKTAVVMVLIAVTSLALINTVRIINCPLAGVPELTQPGDPDHD